MILIGIMLLVLNSRVLQHSELNTEKENSKVSMLTFLNGSDHAMIVCYYMKKVKSSISMIFGPIPNIYSLVVYIHVMRARNSMRMHKKIPVNTQPHGHTSTF